jgi:diadenosine tetraphosphate (Ap4A) HIT family hydrolase
VVVWRGRHVAEPTELEADEATAYWLEVIRVGGALEEALEPVKMNYDLLGNSLPHLHTHVIPRYADDPRPGWPFPFPEGDPGEIDEASFRRDVEALRVLLG